MDVSGSKIGKEPTRFFVLMGVCGVGKTTVAAAVAEKSGAAFVEADHFHSPENIATMSRQVALSDEQRWPWLEAVCAGARSAATDGRPVVIACSALKKSYRDFMRARLTAPVFIHLHGDRDVIQARLDNRTSHFMPSAMLKSQLADLESPVGEVGTYSVDITDPKHRVVEECISIFRQHVAAADPGGAGVAL